MDNQYRMPYYRPEVPMSYDQDHQLLYTFQYEDALAQLVTSLNGNVAGGDTMMTEFDTGLTVPIDHELNIRHAKYYDDDDEKMKYREVEKIMFYYPSGEVFLLPLEECTRQLIGIQIIGYQP